MKHQYENLKLVCFQYPSDRHNNYRYLVTDRQSPHTAFRNVSGLKRWLSDRNLSLKLIKKWQTDNHAGITTYLEIVGKYASVMMMDCEEFDRISAPTTQVMSNGSYTLGKIVNGDECVEITYLNPNADRATFDCFKSNKRFG